MYNLHHFLTEYSPVLVFLSEPQIFSCDISTPMTLFHDRYKFVLNSDDKYNPLSPLDKNKASGGTLAMWLQSYDQYITPLTSPSCAILPLLVKLPGVKPSCHIGIYMPTAGHEEDFVSSLSDLDFTISSARDEYGADLVFFIRGDMNASMKNTSRYCLLQNFLEKHNLIRAASVHPTYHHFIGIGGEFDSDLDVLLFSNCDQVCETLIKQICKNENPLIDSHHDLLLSEASLPSIQESPIVEIHSAPKKANNRVKILWSEEGKKDYEVLLKTYLDSMATRWCDSKSTANTSVLLSATNEILRSAAMLTNRFVDLSQTPKTRQSTDPSILKLRKHVHSIHKKRSHVPHLSNEWQRLNDELISARSLYRNKVRTARQMEDATRDEKLTLFSSNQSSIFKAIKKEKNISSGSLSKLRVSDMTFGPKSTGDGFHKSLSLLKAPDLSSIEETCSFHDTLRDYHNIMGIVQSANKIPLISIHDSIDILYSVRQDVNDLYSISAAHFINAGSAGLRHFHLLLTTLLSNINNSSIQELNDIWAMILYKGHGKDKESDRSYRTISTCPLLAKCLDVYVGRCYYGMWKSIGAPTQFQGEGSSHELASLLLTETISFSLYQSRKPIFVIFLDAKSAFDVVLRQNAIVEAYKAGTQDQGLIYLNNRLKSRRTYVEWERSLMGPIEDLRGLEQGAVNSDRIYKLCNNSQLEKAQASNMGVDLDGIMVASIGQADDVALLSDSPEKLRCLLCLTSLYCSRQHVELVPEKTRLLVWTPKNKQAQTNLLKLSCPIFVGNKQIEYSSSADHVGVVRSTNGGNIPHIMDRISAHIRAISYVLHSGAARHHTASPSSTILLDKLYGASVLFSGIASLVLTEKELSIVDKHYKKMLCRYQKLPLNSPDCVIYFLSGSLPARAILHLRMLSLLGMIARLGPNSILQKIGRQSLLATTCNKKSWFYSVRSISKLYDLPDPLLVLQDGSNSSKEAWKRKCKASVVSYWEQYLRGQADLLPSLKYFKPQFMSLSRPHSVWTIPESGYEIKKAHIVATMLSGRYFSDYHARHWSKTNKDGFCQLCLAASHSLDHSSSIPSLPLGTLEHMLVECPALQETRNKCRNLWHKYCSDQPLLWSIVQELDATVTPPVQLLLDPSCSPLVIKAVQDVGEGILIQLQYLTRTWCYSHHLRRHKYLKLYNII